LRTRNQKYRMTTSRLCRLIGHLADDPASAVF
jgi:hypothetical protein